MPFDVRLAVNLSSPKIENLSKPQQRFLATLKDRLTGAGLCILPDVISAIRQFLAVTGSIAPLAMQEYHAGQMEMLSANPDFRKIFGDADEPLNPELLNLLQTQVTQLVLSNASAAIDAASLVFAQSIVDDAAWSYLKVFAMVDPAAWDGQIDDRKIGVKDLKAKSWWRDSSRSIAPRKWRRSPSPSLSV